MIDSDDESAVLAVLRSDLLTGGPAVEDFESAIAETVGARHAVAFSSGTAGLHGAAAAAGLGPGDLVAASTLTFAATGNCALYMGADLVLLDVDGTWNLDLEKVPTGIDALIATHFAGLPVELDALPRRPRVVIEDAAHALGAASAHGPVGNCAHSDMCVFSFHPVKSIAAGEGGMVTTNSDVLARRLRAFRNHGIEPVSGNDGWGYDITDVGFNYRLSELHAALGRSQLRKLAAFVGRRNELADAYDELLRDLPVQTPPAAGGSQLHARHLYPVLVADRDQVMRRMHESGVGVQVHYRPLHRLTRFAGRAGPVPHADRIADTILSIPLHVGLDDATQENVVEKLRLSLSSASADTRR